MPTGAEFLGAPVEGFDFAQHYGALRSTKMSFVHRKLEASGYIFVGWHGSKLEACTNLINGDGVRPSRFDKPEQKIWEGFYVFDHAERTVGYTEDRNSKIIRAYVKLGEVRHMLADDKDINKVLEGIVPAEVSDGSGSYVISGPDGTGEIGHEMVISKALLPHTVFLPSLHQVDWSGARVALRRHPREAVTAIGGARQFTAEVPLGENA